MDVESNMEEIETRDSFNKRIINTSSPVDLGDTNNLFLEDTTKLCCEDDSKMEVQNIETDEQCETKDVNFPSLPLYNFSSFSYLTKFNDVLETDKCFRGCKWAPDGTCLLVNCEDKTLRLLDLPLELYEKTTWNNGSLSDINPSLKVTESGLVYDFDWYPFMSSWDQATSCFIGTSTDCPVHLYDAFTGKIRASYRGYDQYDEVAHAFCVSFSSTGTSIFCGYNNCIKIFDVSKPGRDCFNINTKQNGNQKGIISCICNNPEMPTIFAAGSYRRTIGIYAMDGSSLCQLVGHKGGLTQLKFSSDGVRLYSAGRKDSEIICWDLRHPGKTLFTLKRPHTTNQRIYFDLSADNRYLVSGSTDGKLRIWNAYETFSDTNQPTFELEPHKDCTNGVSIHRQLPILATSSGQRQIPDIVSDDEEDSIIFRKSKNLVDNSVKIWWIGKTDN